MATPILEQVALKLYTRLGLITTANGYETTASGIVRPTKLFSGRLKDYQIIISQGTVELNDDLSRPGNPPAVAWDIPFSIFGELRPSDTSTKAIESLCNEFGADIIKAICTPAASWHNWDGLAIDSQFTSVDIANSEEFVGVKVELTVTIRTAESNPYTLRT